MSDNVGGEMRAGRHCTTHLCFEQLLLPVWRGIGGSRSIAHCVHRARRRDLREPRRPMSGMMVMMIVGQRSIAGRRGRIIVVSRIRT